MVIFFLVVFFCCSVQPRPSPGEESDGSEVTDEDVTIQKNPNYTEPVKNDIVDNEDLVDKDAKDVKEETEETYELVEIDEEEEETPSDSDDDMEEDSDDEHYGDDDYDEYDEEGECDEEDEEESKDAVKRVLAQALSKSRNVPRYTVKFVKKNRVKLTVAAALYAFRKEIGRIAYHILTKPKTIDPETGEVLSRTINLSPTSLLKILLFIDFMRKLNSGEVSETGPLGSKRSILYKLLHPANTAFVPPIEQHWTFEKVNERYDKDSMAFQKAMGASGAALGMRKKPMAQSLGSFVSNAILRDTTQDKQDLVILLDWTKLTQSLDRMSSLRDQVSFLLSQHRAKNNMMPTTPVSNTTNVNVTETTEIIVILESPGGAAADYGLASQMMLRLSHEPGLVVTVCVDKVAASGGYMVACASSPGRLFGTYDFAVLFIACFYITHFLSVISS